MDVTELPLEQLIPYARNPRKNDSAVATVAASLKEFGWRQPIVVDEGMVILAGHTRLEAARQLGTAVDVYLDGGPCGEPVPSTIVDLTGEQPTVLRLGALSLEELRAVVPDLVERS